MLEGKCASRCMTLVRDAEVVSLGHTGRGRNSRAGFCSAKEETCATKAFVMRASVVMNEIVCHVMAVLMFDKEAIVEVSIFS